MHVRAIIPDCGPIKQTDIYSQKSEKEFRVNEMEAC